MRIGISKYVRLSIVGVIALSVSYCSSDQPTTGIGSIDNPSSGSTTTPTDAPLYLQLIGHWENSSNVSFTNSTCYVPNGTASGSTITCTITVPEGTLHYSDVDFVVGSNSSTTCSQVSFYPYYFQRSNLAAYTPSGASAPIVCNLTRSLNDPNCYSGAAKSLVPDFPTYTGIYFVPGSSLEATYTLESSNSLGATLTDDLAVISTNTNVANCYSGIGTIPANLDFVAASIADYRIYCTDAYDKPKYTIVLTLVDTDDSTTSVYDGLLDDFWDWEAD